jgi:hypothetical protein
VRHYPRNGRAFWSGGHNGAAIDPDSYDYRRAARDAIHFPALVDRFWQNTRRCVGWNVQYFGTVEPQKSDHAGWCRHR